MVMKEIIWTVSYGFLHIGKVTTMSNWTVLLRSIIYEEEEDGYYDDRDRPGIWNWDCDYDEGFNESGDGNWDGDL